MTRKAFLPAAARGLVVALAVLTLGRCSSESVPLPPPDGTFTSSNSEGHRHNFVVTREDIEDPPADGISGQTTIASGHSHAFAMSRADLLRVRQWEAVLATTGETNGHTHDFTIQRWF